jgi:hypothetical protein
MKKKKIMDGLWCRGVAAMTAEVITFPMDTAKTRLQLQQSAPVRRHVA